MPGASKTSSSSPEEATPSSPQDASADHNPTPSRQRGEMYSRASPTRTKRSPFAPPTQYFLSPSSLPLKRSRQIIPLLLWYSHREEESQKETRSRTPKMGPTVGRPCDPQWVVITTYCRFFRRPTVGRFLLPLRMPSKETETAPLPTMGIPLAEGRRRRFAQSGKIRRKSYEDECPFSRTQKEDKSGGSRTGGRAVRRETKRWASTQSASPPSIK